MGFSTSQLWTDTRGTIRYANLKLEWWWKFGKHFFRNAVSLFGHYGFSHSRGNLWQKATFISQIRLCGRYDNQAKNDGLWWWVEYKYISYYSKKIFFQDISRTESMSNARTVSSISIKMQKFLKICIHASGLSNFFIQRTEPGPRTSWRCVLSGLRNEEYSRFCF